LGCRVNPISREEKFWSKVDKNSNPLGCWEWTGYIEPEGYGQTFWKDRLQRVHRIAWFLTRGSIPKGKCLDHLCRNKKCVNPDHLEVVTLKENTLRGFGLTAQLARQTHCKRGHPLSGENLYEKIIGDRIERNCRACKKMYFAQWRAKNPDYWKEYERI